MLWSTFTLCVAAALIAWHAIDRVCELLDVNRLDPLFRLSLALQHSVVPFSESPTYVPRPALEARVDRLPFRNAHFYGIVTGTQGSGKSTVVRAALANRPGAVAVSFGLDSSHDDGFALVVSALGREFTVAFPDSSARLLNSICASAAGTAGPDVRLWQSLVAAFSGRPHPSHERGWAPTIVVDIENGGRNSTTLGAVLRALELLKACRVLVVLSDDHAAFALPGSGYTERHSVIWVDDFTLEEANAFLDARQAWLVADNDTNAKRRAALFDQMGTRPLHLAALIQSDDAQTRALASARSHIIRLLARKDEPDGKQFAMIMNQLLDLQNPDAGVKIRTFNGALGAAHKVAALLQQPYRNALLVHHPTLTYRFHSRIHLLAARKLRTEGVL